MTSIFVPGKRLTVHCSPVERIFLTGVGSAVQRAWGNGLTNAEFDLSDWDSHYCRVTVRDRQRRQGVVEPDLVGRIVTCAIAI